MVRNNDFDNYMEDPGFIYNYEHIFPEKINTNFDSFILDLDRAISGKISNRQNKLKNIFHNNIDGQNSERIYKKVQELRSN